MALKPFLSVVGAEHAAAAAADDGAFAGVVHVAGCGCTEHQSEHQHDPYFLESFLHNDWIVMSLC